MTELTQSATCGKLYWLILFGAVSYLTLRPTKTEGTLATKQNPLITVDFLFNLQIKSHEDQVGANMLILGDA
jgi:hypothetical protein